MVSMANGARGCFDLRLDGRVLLPRGGVRQHHQSGKSQWEQLLLDIEDHHMGYFMGSIICVHDNAPATPGAEIIYEVVDGQVFSGSPECDYFHRQLRREMPA